MLKEASTAPQAPLVTHKPQNTAGVQSIFLLVRPGPVANLVHAARLEQPHETERPKDNVHGWIVCKGLHNLAKDA